MMFKFKKRPTYAGVSLLEVVVYTAIFAFISVAALNTVLAMTRFAGELRKSRALYGSAEAGMERMVREIRLAKSVDDANSVFGVTPGTLSLNTADEAGESTTAVFKLENNSLMLQKGGGNFIPLTSSEINISKLIFAKIENSTSSGAIVVSEAIKIEMTANAGGERGYNFYDTAVLRGSY